MISREPDGSFNEDYCTWCYTDGHFVYETKDALLDFLIANMGLFFVPPGVALMLYLDIIEAQLLPIVAATVISTLLVFVSTGWVYQLIRRHK